MRQKVVEVIEDLVDTRNSNSAFAFQMSVHA